ncbi:hypothetical protein NIES593_01765 [Hydrococcus rivularis NIES-593]|uniref:Uncharacterized protein n=1 Tax=Hydrococcus rivularis NIES-593 TaxID=1921803 RepID=A0A1U7HTD7_9CYAN|nr:hypothetical protein NIES593_01765 [Hydrococcus rivularis NIES-593]
MSAKLLLNAKILLNYLRDCFWAAKNAIARKRVVAEKKIDIISQHLTGIKNNSERFAKDPDITRSKLGSSFLK